MPANTLSVVISNYNDAEHVGASLTAICGQGFLPQEVIIVDDGSTDNSVEVIQEVAARYPIIRLIRNEHNRGVIYSVNKATKEATGDYIYFASANDLVLPGFFEKSIELLSQYPDAGFCCSDCKVINVPDGTEYQLRSNWAQQPTYLSPDNLVSVMRSAKVAHPWGNTCIVRRSALPQEQVYIPDLEWHTDWFLFVVIAARHGCCYIPDVLAAWKWLGNSYWYSGTNNSKLYRQVFTKIIQLLVSPEYEDVARFVIQGRGFRFVKYPIRTPLVAAKALRSMLRQNSHAAALFQHLALEYIREFCTPTTLSSGFSKWLLKPASEVFETASGYLHNLCDRIYARTFHEYARVRSLVTKR